MDTFDWLFLTLKIIVIFGAVFTTVPLMTWVERRGAGLMQNRLGPNRVGPLGIFQPIADGVKFLFKEDPVPGHVNKFYYVLAPLLALVPAILSFAVIPIAGPLTLNGRVVSFQIADLNVGLLYVFAVLSLGTFGIVMAGWASNSKYSLIGSLRSASQMISYELALGLSVIGIIMSFSTVHLGEIAQAQGQALLHLGRFTIPKWGIFIQPLGFLVFLMTTYAETNRLPFDLPEGESEIIAGYHVEYGSLKFVTFFMAEYLAMATASGLVATLYFGGWQLLPGLSHLMVLAPQGTWMVDGLRVLLEILSFSIKMSFFLWLFVWVRWTLPRFRYDQLMDFGWKVALPLSVGNILLTAVLIYLKVI